MVAVNFGSVVSASRLTGGTSACATVGETRELSVRPGRVFMLILSQLHQLPKEQLNRRNLEGA